MSEPNLAEDRPAHYRAVALLALERLSAGDADPDTLHRARTHLRRFQAYLELIGEDRRADAVERCIVRLSKLRMLQVFARFLKKLDAPRSDRMIVARCVQARCRKLERTRTYAAIERMIHRYALPATHANPEWLAERMLVVRAAHAEVLHRLIAEAGTKPRRKTLHRLRLLIKSIRYQEEWALDRPYAMPELVLRLKHTQAVLGDYEDLFQFRKLSRALKLRSSPVIKEHWRKARTRARALPARLVAYLRMTAAPRIRLVNGRNTSVNVAG